MRAWWEGVRDPEAVGKRNRTIMPMHLVDVVTPVVAATLCISATSTCKDPQRRHVNALIIAGVGAASLNGGLGLWECAFTAVVTLCASQGLHA
jgi:hypothetical protein